MYPRISPARARRLLGELGRSPFDRGVDIPGWYLRHWHYLPGGYLSHAGATAYDIWVRRLYYAGLEDLAHGLVAEAIGAVAGSGRILDAGSGSGQLLEALGKRLPAAQLTGVDLSPRLLDRAWPRLGGLAKRVRLTQADLTHLPFEAAEFDAVTAAHVLGHVPSGPGAQALSELTRVLRPGGRLVLIEHAWHSRLPGSVELTRLEVLRAGPLLRVQVHERQPSPEYAQGRSPLSS